MSKIEELIQQLCPNGVEWKKIGDVCNTITDYTAAGSFANIAENVKYISEKEYAQLVRTTDLKSNFSNPDKFVYKEIGISAVRGGTIVGEHEVIFAGTDEVIEFKHTAYSRGVFAKGAVEAGKFLAGKEAGMYDMGDVIGL